LIEAFPVVLRHQTKGTEQREAEIVEVRVAVVGIWTDPYARVVGWTGTVNTYRAH